MIDRELQDKHDAYAMLSAFGVACTYLPKGGGSRSLTAIVDEDGTFRNEQTGKFSVETIRVFVLREDDATYGGIDSPQIGDGLQLGRDASDKAYSWEGEKLDSSRYSWTLRYVRKLPYELGGNRSQ